MEVCVASIVQNLDPPAELTNDLLTIAEPKSGKTLIEIAVILGTLYVKNQDILVSKILSYKLR